MRLRQPFEISLKEKQQRMDVTIEAMGRLVEYEIAAVTAAATDYMAETYFDFSRPPVESERAGELGGELTLDGGPGRGTRLTVSLPLSTGSSENSQASQVSSSSTTD